MVASVARGVAPDPWWMLAVVVPALAAAPWARTASLVWLTTGCRGPRPRAEPTVAWKEEHAPESAASPSAGD